MDYKEKVIALLNSQELTKEQKEKLENIFPELKEDNDERIRKGLIKAVSRIFEGHKLFDTDVTREEALAWLEKQKLTDEEIIFRPIAGTDIRIAAKQALEKIDIGKKVVLAFNGAYIPVNGKTVGDIDSEYDAWLENQGENKHTEDKTIFAKCFPELKESKDERIRKTIYGWIHTEPSEFFDNGFSKEEMLAWVEKQGENKKLDADKVIAWLVANIVRFEYYVKLFKKDFGL